MPQRTICSPATPRRWEKGGGKQKLPILGKISNKNLRRRHATDVSHIHNKLQKGPHNRSNSSGTPCQVGLGYVCAADPQLPLVSRQRGPTHRWSLQRLATYRLPQVPRCSGHPNCSCACFQSKCLTRCEKDCHCHHRHHLHAACWCT